MDKGKSLHTKDAEELKAHLPHSDFVEGRTSKFWSSERRDLNRLVLLE